jgi:hypothetical protein
MKPLLAHTQNCCNLLGAVRPFHQQLVDLAALLVNVVPERVLNSRHGNLSSFELKNPPGIEGALR